MNLWEQGEGVFDAVIRIRDAIRTLKLQEAEQPSPSEMLMLVLAGVEAKDVIVALDRISWLAENPRAEWPRSLWGYARAIAWGEAVKRHEIIQAAIDDHPGSETPSGGLFRLGQPLQ